MSQKKDNQNVLVGVRIRPRNEKEIQASMPVYFNQTVDSQSVQELDENGIPIKHWGFDRVFGPESTNREIFETMGMKLVDGALEGYNTVMFMYGQTSSGKTFTLFGDNNNLGVIDHAMEYLNHRVKTSIDIEYVIKLTYAELYNEELKDLLSATPNDNLKIIEDPNLGPMIQNITEASFASAADIRQILDEGERRRHFGVTNMNAHSSRSHVIVRLCIESRKVPYRPGNALRQSWGKDRPTCISTLNLVDLAGSERANKAGTTGQALKEGSYINKSLLTLGTVIANLSEGKLQHIPYRNSKLTRLLATALGGNAKTCVITCISPASGNLAESLNTLRFASRAKRVVNHVQKNEIMDMKTLTNKLALQLTEIEGLRAQLEMARQIGYVPDEEEANSGETIRDKAIMISKYWRSLRFFLANGGKMITFLRSVGMSHLAKKIPSDLRGIISGGREISEVLEDYSSILQTYLQKEGRGLLGKIQEIMTVNESEVIINLSTMFENMFPDLDDNSTNNSVVDLSSLFQECDVFHLLEDGGEELKEQLETTQFYNEDIFNRFNIFSNRHTQEINDWVNKEKQYKKQVEELQYSVVEKNETIKQLRQSESLLTHQIENSVEKWKSDVSSQKGFITDLTNKMGSLELKITDQETVIHMKEQELIYRDFEIDKYKNQIEQLNADLANANQLKKQIEEESTRQRSEMRVQMERLRQNMHELLIQGGEEAKVIESHNSQLQHEIDTLKDELTAAISVKQRVEMENQQLRSQLSITLEDLKVQFHSATTLKDEKMDLLNKIRDSKLEITKYQSEITFLQQNLLKVEQENELNKNQYDELLLAKDKEIELIQYRNKMKMNDLNLEIEMKDTELESFKDQLQQKQTFLIRFEQSYSSDMNRLEKKLFHQTKLADELSVENNNLYLQMQSLHHKYNEEIRQLKQKNQELQHSIDSINNYIEDKEKELFLPDNNHNDVENDKNDEIQGSYLAHSLMRQQDQKGSGGSSSKKSLSRYASRFYLNDNGKVLNNFNSYYDMSSFYSSAPSTLNSDVADDWSDLASSPSNRRDSGRHQRRFSFQSDLPEDDYMYDDDDLSVQSSTVRNHLQPTASTEKMEKIKQFNDYYQGDKKDEFDIPLVQIDENFSVSNDFDHSYPIIQGQSKTHLPFTPPPISASPAARSIMQKKKSDLGASGGLMTSPPSQTPSSAPKVKFLSHSLHESAEPGAQLTPVPALTVNTTASWSPDPFPDGESELLKPEESPKRALDDPRLVQQLKQYEIEHQQQFESIYYGLSLSTLLLEVIYEEEKLLRQGNYSQHHQQFQQSLQQQSEINNIIIEKDSLYEKNQQLVNSLNFLQEKNEFLTKIYKELEEKYNKLIHEYTTITHSDRLKQTQLYSLEENMLSEKVKIDKYQLENHRYQQVIYDLKVNNLTLQSDKEVLEEKLSIMESQLDLIKQEKDLLSVERDEVIRRFLPNLLKK